MRGAKYESLVGNHHNRHPTVFRTPGPGVVAGYRLATPQPSDLDILRAHADFGQGLDHTVGAAHGQLFVVGLLARGISVPVYAHALDTDAGEGLADAFDDFSTGLVEFFIL